MTFASHAQFNHLSSHLLHLIRSGVLPCHIHLSGNNVALPARPELRLGRAASQTLTRVRGQKPLSSRNLFWSDLEAAISNRPWFGYGAGSIAETFTGYGWSSHNFYLPTALQVGFVGLAGLMALLWVIWGQLWRGRQSVAVRLFWEFSSIRYLRFH